MTTEQEWLGNTPTPDLIIGYDPASPWVAVLSLDGKIVGYLNERTRLPTQRAQQILADIEKVNKMAQPTPENCPNPEVHGNPFRYCPYCSWIEEPEIEDVKIPDLKLPAQKPTLGRVVLYRVSREDCQRINARREDAEIKRPGDKREGVQVHVGNRAIPGDVYAADIVRVWGDHEGALVNLQVKLDGNDTYWATSVHQGDDEGEWNWPTRG